MRDFLLTLSAAIVLVVFGSALGIAAAKIQCTSQWAESGHPSRYDYLGGCMVQRANGTWVPARAIRDISL